MFIAKAALVLCVQQEAVHYLLPFPTGSDMAKRRYYSNYSCVFTKRKTTLIPSVSMVFSYSILEISLFYFFSFPYTFPTDNKRIMHVSTKFLQIMGQS